MLIHPSRTITTEWVYHPRILSGDPHVMAVSAENVYNNHPDCIFLWFSSGMREETGGLAIYYDFPVLMREPLRLRAFGRSGPRFPHANIPFTYRLRVQVYNASDVLLQQWTLNEGVDFPHYKMSNPMPADPNLIPIITLIPAQTWKRLRIIGSIVGLQDPRPILPLEVEAGDEAWSELSVSYIEAGPAGRRMLRIRPMTGASV